MERKRARDRTIRDDLELMPEAHRLDEREFAYFGRVIEKPEKKEE